MELALKPRYFGTRTRFLKLLATTVSERLSLAFQTVALIVFKSDTIKYLLTAHFALRPKSYWDPPSRTPFFLSPITGLPRSGKSQGKTKIFQGKGKVRKFFKKSGKIFDIVKVS